MSAEVRLLEDTEVDLLQGLLLLKLGALVTRTLDVWPVHAEVRDLALRRHDGRYVIIASDWSDTPQEALDYHHIEVFLSDSPLGVPVSVNERGAESLGDPCSLIHIHPPERITAISIYDRREACGIESVHYDAGLLFDLADGRRFLLSTPDSILGGLEYSAEASRIAEFTFERSARLILEGSGSHASRPAG